MVDRAYGRKKSDFVAKSSVDAGAYIDYFVNGTNYKISYDNFLSGLGVTGTIVQDGAVTGTPVLNVDGTVNNIRNIEDGSGITSSVTAENGIEIKHNFTVDSTGEPLMQNTTATSPTFASIVGGTGIDVATSGTTIEISSSEATSYATVTMQGNSTATVISVATTPVKAAGTFVVGDESAYSGDTTGKITYTGPDSRHIINAVATIDAASGSNHLVSLHIAINGSVVATTKMTDVISANLPRSIATFLNADLNTDDYIEIYVSNDSTTDNLIVENAILGAL